MERGLLVKCAGRQDETQNVFFTKLFEVCFKEGCSTIGLAWLQAGHCDLDGGIYSVPFHWEGVLAFLVEMFLSCCLEDVSPVLCALVIAICPFFCRCRCIVVDVGFLE